MNLYIIATVYTWRKINLFSNKIYTNNLISIKSDIYLVRFPKVHTVLVKNIIIVYGVGYFAFKVHEREEIVVITTVRLNFLGDDIVEKFVIQ